MQLTWFLKAAGRACRAACVGAGLALVLLGVSGSVWAGSGPPPPTPEIDPGAMGSALALLTGGTLILVDRLRRK